MKKYLLILLVFIGCTPHKNRSMTNAQIQARIDSEDLKNYVVCRYIPAGEYPMDSISDCGPVIGGIAYKIKSRLTSSDIGKIIYIDATKVAKINAHNDSVMQDFLLKAHK